MGDEKEIKKKLKDLLEQAGVYETFEKILKEPYRLSESALGLAENTSLLLPESELKKKLDDTLKDVKTKIESLEEDAMSGLMKLLETTVYMVYLEAIKDYKDSEKKDRSSELYI